jgi:hypothetical protein
MAARGLGRPRTVARLGRGLPSPVIAANDQGAVVAWVEYRRGVFRIRAAIAGAGAFGPPAVIARGDSSGPGVAVLPSGALLLAWRENDDHRVVARYRSPAGALGPPQVLTRRQLLNSRPVMLGDAVAWYDSERRERVVRLARVGEDGRFGPARELGRDSIGEESAFAPLPDGIAFVLHPPWAPADPIRWQHLAG